MKSIFTASLFLFAFAPAAQCAPVLSIFSPEGSFNPTPPTQAIDQGVVGETFIMLFLASGDSFGIGDGPSDLAAFSFDLSFNPSVLQVAPGGVVENGYFAQNGVGLYSSVNNATGLISDISDSKTGPGPGENLTYSQPLDGSDTLLTIAFTAVGAGATGISVLQNGDLYFADSNGNFTTPTTGSAEVVVSPVLGGPAPSAPEPETAGLLACAGVVLIIGARMRMRKSVAR